MDRQRYWEICSNDRGFTGLQVWKERRSGAVYLATCSFHHLSITVVRQTMNDERSNLTQNPFGDVAWPLCGQANVQTKLPAFLGDQLKRIKPRHGILAANLFSKEIVRFIDNDNDRRV